MAIKRRIASVVTYLVASSWMVYGASDYSPALKHDYPKQVYWGDTHLHSAWSFDANLTGNLSITPDQAYRFARGEPVVASNGMTAQLERPLDFLVVADHGGYMGLLPKLRSGEVMPTDFLNNLSRIFAAFERPSAASEFVGEIHSGKSVQATDAHTRDMLDAAKLSESFMTAKPLPGTGEILSSTWQAHVSLAEVFNEPGVFTALSGYEWTSMAGFNNLHRVVIFREGAGMADQVAPFTWFDSANPEDLWTWMAEYEQKTRGRILAIPHNGNMSNGLMFGKVDYEGNPVDADYAQRRARWEPINEITQIKGDGEAHPLLSPNDEFADYGTFDFGNFGGDPKTEDMLQFEYARSALKLGLSLERRTGVNPYKFGAIGSTDSHNGLTTADDNNYWGKLAYSDEPGKEGRLKGPFGGTAKSRNSVQAWEQLASGYAAVWARTNTREALFDAMLRREVYATTGPRMTVRFFGGWDYSDDTAQRPDYVAIGYERGVPMGADLPARTQDRAPVFLVSALKDPEGANLDRVQVVKGWLDSTGSEQEKVYDVVWSDGRKRNASGKLPPVGNTVDLMDASYVNSIGEVQLSAVWTDPDFNPAESAFYYVRVLEIPTPRWPVYDRQRLGAELEAETELVHQERAYTSPIWYTPKME